MSNSFYTPDQIAQVTAVLVNEDLRLAQVVSRALEGDFQPGGGRSVLLPIPGALIARDRSIDETTAAIVVDSISESTVPVTLTVHAYSAVGLSEGDISLDLADFSRQVLRPQAEAVADRIEEAVAAALADVDEDTTIAYDAADPVKTFTALRRALRGKGANVAAGELVAIVGGTVFDDLLDSGAFDADKTGGNDETLRKANVGTVRNFSVMESDRIDAGMIYAFPKAAVSLVVRAPEVPEGASFGEKITHEGLSLRYLRDYDAGHTQDRSLVSTFVKAVVLPAYRVTRDYTTDEVTVDEVTGGQIVAVDTSTIPA